MTDKTLELLGFNSAGITYRNVSSIRVEGGDQLDVLQLEDSANPVGRRFQVKNNEVIANGLATIQYAGMEVAGIQGGSGIDEFLLDPWSSTADMILNGGPGDDRFTAPPPMEPGAAAPSATIGLVMIDGQAGRNTLEFDDRSLGAAQVYRILGRDVARAGGSPLSTANLERIEFLTATKTAPEILLVDATLTEAQIYILSAQGISRTEADLFFSDPRQVTVRGTPQDDVVRLEIPDLGYAVLLNAGAGSDTYEIPFDGTFAQVIGVEDTGAMGADNLLLMGTPGSEPHLVLTDEELRRQDIRRKIESDPRKPIRYAGVEKMTLDGRGGFDQLVIHGPLEVMLTVRGVFENDVLAFIEGFYTDILGRSSDGGGRAFFQTVLDSSRAPLFRTLATQYVTSIEARANLIKEAYRNFLERKAENSEVDHWLRVVEGGAALETVLARIIGSIGVFERNGNTPGDWLDSVYEHVLGRPRPWIASVLGSIDHRCVSRADRWADPGQHRAPAQIHPRNLC